MTDQFDPKLMKMGDDAFWTELNAKRGEAWDEGGIKRYMVMDSRKNVKVLITDANLETEKKIEV